MERLSDYDYQLPEELIAQTPLDDRSSSRLLHLDKGSGGVRHRAFLDSLEILRPGDLLVMNDTRVSALRILGHRPTGGSAEALLLSELSPGRFEALVKPGKRLKVGAKMTFQGGIEALVAEDLEEGLRVLDFQATDNLQRRLEEVGTVPLPPYIHQQLADSERYQTVYGRNRGSAAAPTAGLHFTSQALAALQARGVSVAFVTLHVGIDTFRPVHVDDLREHRMHGERCVLWQKTAKEIQNCTGRVVAVGTTTVRTLESFATGPKQLRAGEIVSKLFIKPGYRFQIVDGMFTNFHLPKTTMLMMISAMAGKDAVLQSYREAVREGYRFLSFGDSMLIL